MPKSNYFIRVGDALSQFLNTILGGHPNESLSGRSYRQGLYTEKIINLLFSHFETEHCKKAYENDVKYAVWLTEYHKNNKK